MHLHRTQRPAPLDLPNRAVFQKRALCVIGIKRVQFAGDGKAAQGDPGMPKRVAVKRCRNHVDAVTQPVHLVQSSGTGLKHPRLHRQSPPPIGEPGDALVRRSTRHLRQRWGLIQAKGLARIGTCHCVQQCGQVTRASCHRAIAGQRMQICVARRLGRHHPPTGTHAIDVVPARRIAQRPHHIRSIRHAQHARGQSHRRTTGRPPGTAAQVIRIAGRAKNGVHRMGPKSKLRRIRLADDNRASGTQTGHHDIVLLRHLPREQGRAHRRGQPFRIGEVLDRDGYAVQPPLGRLCIRSPRLSRQSIRIAQRHHRIHRAVHSLNAGQSRLHHLDRTDLTPGKRRTQIKGIHRTNFHDRSERNHGTRHKAKPHLLLCSKKSRGAAGGGWPPPPSDYKRRFNRLAHPPGSCPTHPGPASLPSTRPDRRPTHLWYLRSHSWCAGLSPFDRAARHKTGSGCPSQRRPCSRASRSQRRSGDPAPSDKDAISTLSSRYRGSGAVIFRNWSPRSRSARG
mmetsp:Transcript_27376/g.50288  ORF Transcript_27376/g.50288 Transcript_27376/m.50288 type:complete len:509 (+) Transcript_27376:1695-3221(+)